MVHTAEARDVSRYLRARKRSESLFAIAREEAYYLRPIPLRNPIVFYEGHLPAFAVNTLVKLAQGKRGIDERFERLFERGIDPEAPVSDSGAWPSRAEVKAYAAEADARVVDALHNLGDSPLEVEAASAIVEHELMHQETLMYMFHALPYEMKVSRPAKDSSPGVSRRGDSVDIPAGFATLGADRESFGWDNEFPRHRVYVKAFCIDPFNVTNEEYLEFVRAGAKPPHFWTDGAFRGMFGVTPLPNAPAWVTHEEATAYARWKGKRLPTEAEYHRAWGDRMYPWGDEPPGERHGNFDFRSWDPQPVGSHPEGASPWGVHDLVGDGWEWTSTPFAGFDGFEPMAVYPVYSADFFDGKHFVLKGASPVTPRELIRSSFRNWFRPNYPYVYAKFRLAV